MAGWRLARQMASSISASTLALTGSTGFASPPTPSQGAATGSIEADGAVDVPSFRLPPSVYLSPAARAALPRKVSDPTVLMDHLVAIGQAGAARAKIGELMAPQINHLRSLYSVTLSDTTIAGVPAVIVRPATMPTANAGKVLLELPGGGFVMGAAHGTGMVESIPLSALAKLEVISITYRQAPEYNYPAANEDVIAVYRELLKTHRPQDIAISGCSAGGVLTAESIAWFLKEKLPLPAAIGIFCASADARFEGDSRAYSRPFHAYGTEPERPRGYFQGVDMTDPLVSPIFSQDILKQFPPTLLVTAVRAQDLSSAVDTHRKLVLAGVDAELNVWDGLGHAFFYDIDLPESKEAYGVMAKFFSKHLDLAP